MRLIETSFQLVARLETKVAYATQSQTVTKIEARPVPVLLPRPERVQIQQPTGMLVGTLKRLQGAEYSRSVFAAAVAKTEAKALAKANKARAKAAQAARAGLRAKAVQTAKAQLQLAKAAQAAAVKAEAQAKAAAQFIKSERARTRQLDMACKSRIAAARARGFKPAVQWVEAGLFVVPCIRGLDQAAALLGLVA
jgi:hypothetical protein